MRRIRVKSIGFWLLGMATAMLIIYGFGNIVSVSASASTPIELAQQAADLTQQGVPTLTVCDWLKDNSNQDREETTRYKDSFQAEISPLAKTLISDSTLFEVFTPIDKI
jgi:hypothetical protein